MGKRYRAVMTARHNKIEHDMHKFKYGQLHSGSKHGRIVTERAQAIAIALSSARRIGHRRH